MGTTMAAIARSLRTLRPPPSSSSSLLHTVRSFSISKHPFTSSISHPSFPNFLNPTSRSHAQLPHSLRPIYHGLARSNQVRYRVNRAGGGYSPMNSSGSNFSNRPPTVMAPLFPGPGGEGASKQQMIDCNVQTLAKVLGSANEKDPVGVYIMLYGDESDVKYIIRNISEDSIGHGFECRNELRNVFPRSFLFFSLWEEAKRAQQNMSTFTDEKIVKCYLVLKHINTGYWLVIEKVDRSLLEDNKQYPAFCLISFKVTPRYRHFLRSITRAMLLVTEAGLFHGKLEDRSILIVKSEAKLALIGAYDVYGDIVGDSTMNGVHLSEFFGKVLWRVRGSIEVFHFLEEVRSEFVRKLEFHPLLMNSTERLYFPIAAFTWLIQIRRQSELSVLTAERIHMFAVSTHWWKGEVPKNGLYQVIFKHCKYQNGLFGQIRYMRHIAVHFTDKKFKVTTQEDMEHELSIIFPEFLIELYDAFQMKDLQNLPVFTNDIVRFYITPNRTL